MTEPNSRSSAASDHDSSTSSGKGLAVPKAEAATPGAAPPGGKPKRRHAIVIAALVLVIAGASGYLTQQVQGERQERGEIQGQGEIQERTRYGRPIIREDGKTLLWARDRPDGNGAEWFDMTGALVDPAGFEHGIGKDRIPSIDKPAFVRADDARLRRIGITNRTVVIGWEHEGEAKAYPIGVLNRHELVNDWIGGKPVTVGW